MIGSKGEPVRILNFFIVFVVSVFFFVQVVSRLLLIVSVKLAYYASSSACLLSKLCLNYAGLQTFC